MTMLVVAVVLIPLGLACSLPPVIAVTHPVCSCSHKNTTNSTANPQN
uniref:Uncharacterized protein n=1 Tax=Arundo donax TaxID=35708 RepID=A0A0A8ZEH9_ARUDO